MPTSKRFDKKNPKKRFEMEQSIPVENYPYHGPPAPRFEPYRTSGKAETEVGMTAGVSDVGRLAPHRVLPESQAEPAVNISPLNVSPNHRSSPFYERRAVTINAMSDAVIVEVTTEGAGTFYIKRIGHSYFDTSVEFLFLYDDIIWRRWNFQIGGVQPGNMYQFWSALPARTSARLICRNLAANARLYEAVIDGWFNETAGVSEETGGFS
jgi:hypothetical protein